VRNAAHAWHIAHSLTHVFRAITSEQPGGVFADGRGVIWFFEKDDETVVCEIRCAGDDRTQFEFEILNADGLKTQRFESATELISGYLSEQARLLKDGWRPRADLQVVD